MLCFWKNISKSTLYYYASCCLITIVFILFLYWVSVSRLNDFKNYHASLSKSTTSELAHQVSRFIAEKKRLVALFAKQYQKNIEALIENPNDEDTYKALAKKVNEFFPKSFTFTISNLSGEPYYIDIEGDIGDLCLNDLKSFSKTGLQKPVIHPNHTSYHFDVMSKFNYGNQKGIIFVSFEADVLSDFIKASQAPDHQMILARVTDNILIEVFAVGPRIKIPRSNYNLDEEERNRILSKVKVSNTLWHAIDLHAPNLFAKKITAINKQTSWIVIIILCVVAVSVYFLTREEKLRKRAQQQKEEYLAMLNHELRTPVTSIQGSLELISTGGLGDIPEKARKFAAAALDSSDHLLQIINDILDYDKLSSGSMTLDIRDENILDIVEQAIEETNGYAKKFDSHLKLSADRSSDYSIKADSNIIQQILKNLISNACKYGKENDRIKIALTRKDDSFVISVTDHGPGIPEEHHKTLFDRYTVVDNHTKKSIASTGLGLSIAKSFVELHKGNISFESEVGKGTTFTVELPAQI